MDDETRCVHYRSESDVVALRFGCCDRYYACYKCHAELTDHDSEPWPIARRDESAVYCGVCSTTMTATEYVSTDACPSCGVRFNPGCAGHYHMYFEWVDKSSER